MAANSQWYHQQNVDAHRARVTKILRDLESGLDPDSDDSAYLRNFCQVSLALMASVSAQQMSDAVRNAEISSFIMSEGK